MAGTRIVKVGEREISVKPELRRLNKGSGTYIIFRSKHPLTKDEDIFLPALREEHKEVENNLGSLVEHLRDEGIKKKEIMEKVYEVVTEVKGIYEDAGPTFSSQLAYFSKLEKKLQEKLGIEPEEEIFDAAELVVEEPKPFSDQEEEFFEEDSGVGQVNTGEWVLEGREVADSKIKPKEEDIRSDAYYDLAAEVSGKGQDTDYPVIETDEFKKKYLEMLVVKGETKKERGKREKYFKMLMTTRGEVIVEKMKKVFRKGVKEKKGEEKAGDIQGASIRILGAVEERKPKLDDLFKMVEKYVVDNYDPVMEGSFRRVVKGLYGLLKE